MVGLGGLEPPTSPLSLKSGVKFSLFVQICPKIGGLLSKIMQQSIKFNKSCFSLPQPIIGTV
jgi:hypothetical protein